MRHSVYTDTSSGCFRPIIHPIMWVRFNPHTFAPRIPLVFRATLNRFLLEYSTRVAFAIVSVTIWDITPFTFSEFGLLIPIIVIIIPLEFREKISIRRSPCVVLFIKNSRSLSHSIHRDFTKQGRSERLRAMLCGTKYAFSINSGNSCDTCLMIEKAHAPHVGFLTTLFSNDLRRRKALLKMKPPINYKSYAK